MLFGTSACTTTVASFHFIFLIKSLPCLQQAVSTASIQNLITKNLLRIGFPTVICNMIICWLLNYFSFVKVFSTNKSKTKASQDLATTWFGKQTENRKNNNNIVAAYIYSICKLVILLWRCFICEEISDWNVNKSANRLDIDAPKGWAVPPSVHIYCWCEDQKCVLYLIHLLLSSCNNVLLLFHWLFILWVKAGMWAPKGGRGVTDLWII